MARTEQANRATESVAEMVGFLADASPATLSALQSKYPSQAATILRPGELFGLSDELWDVRLDTTRAALHELPEVCASKASSLRAKLKGGRTAHYAGQACVAIGSAGMLISKAAGAPDSAQYALAGLSLVAALLTLATHSLTHGLDPSHGVFGDYLKFVENADKARALRAQLDVLTRTDKASDALSRQLVRQSEALCKDVRKLLAAQV